MESVKHTFVVCAYGKSPYLEECIESLMIQRKTSQILIATSTMNEDIKKASLKYGIKVYVRDGNSGIAQDWNYALSIANTPYVTIAHQDDIYYPEYSETCVRLLSAEKKPLLFFSDYGEIRGEEQIFNNRLLNVKRVMLLPLRVRRMQQSRFVRRRILSFGSPICCPSVAYALNNLPEEIFHIRYRGAVDWQAWERISRLKGSFVYYPVPLMLHRIHEESETSKIIADKNRGDEDYEMLCSFWGRYIAKIIYHFYGKSQKSNELD